MFKNKYLNVAMVFCLMASLSVWSGCGGGGGDGGGGGGGGGDDGLEVTGFTSTGDLTGSGALTAEDTDGDGVNDRLTANLSGIIDNTAVPPAPIDASTLTAGNFTMTEGLTKGDKNLISFKVVGPKAQVIDCTWTATGDGTTPVDIIFALDTTGSMGARVGAMTNSIDQFFDDLESQGVDVNAGGIVFGDAFNTISDPSSFTVGTGSNAPPDFDLDERPFLDLIDPSSDPAVDDDMDIFLEEIDALCGTFGCGGGDALENACGAIQYAGENSSFRPGALPAILIFTDQNAHTQDTFTTAFSSFDGFETWLPPTTAELETLAATSGASVFVISDGDAGSGGKVLDNLVTGGGASIALPTGDIDLTTLNLLEFLTAGGTLNCNGVLPCGASSCILDILSGSLSGTWTWDVDFFCRTVGGD